MKRAGEPAGHDFGDNRVPGAGQRVRECLTERPELDNLVSVLFAAITCNFADSLWQIDIHQLIRLALRVACAVK